MGKPTNSCPMHNFGIFNSFHLPCISCFSPFNHKLITIKIFWKCEIDETLPKLIKGKELTQKGKGRNKKRGPKDNTHHYKSTN
jgi:hypothetical protein